MLHYRLCIAVATFAELMMQGLMEAMLQGEVESEEQEMQRETAVIEGKANEEKVDIQTLGIGNEAALQNILAELQALLNED